MCYIFIYINTCEIELDYCGVVNVLLCAVFIYFCSLGILTLETLSTMLAPSQNSCLLRANFWSGQGTPTCNNSLS